MRIIVSGAAGFMGREVLALCRDGYRGALCVGCVDIRAGDGISPSLADCPAAADVLIDFSHHTGTLSLLAEAEKRGLPAVIATTGHTDEEKKRDSAVFQKSAGFLQRQYLCRCRAYGAPCA